jgi:hypothetical protein
MDKSTANMANPPTEATGESTTEHFQPSNTEVASPMIHNEAKFTKTMLTDAMARLGIKISQQGQFLQTVEQAYNASNQSNTDTIQSALASITTAGQSATGKVSKKKKKKKKKKHRHQRRRTPSPTAVPAFASVDEMLGVCQAALANSLGK